MSFLSLLRDYCTRGRTTLSNGVNRQKYLSGKARAIGNWAYYFAWAGWHDFKVRFLISDDLQRKRQSALTHWLYRKAEEGELHHDHFEYYYTDHVGLSKDYYTGKKILDIGCGPRGSLEWADNAAARVGIDPAIDLYQKIGIDHHTMEYRDSKAEDLPFDDGDFDVVICGNALDHVMDLDATIAEIARVVADDGLCLIITEVKDEATIPEPQTFDWVILDEFKPEFHIEYKDARHKIDEGVYESAKYGPEYDISNDDGAGVLTALLRRRQRSS